MNTNQMDKFYIQAAEKIRDLLTGKDIKIWQNTLDELFKEAISLLSGGKYFLFIHKLVDYSDNYIYYHIMNIAFVSIRIGKELGFSDSQLKNLFVMCLFDGRKDFGIDSNLLKTLYQYEQTSDEIIKVANIFDSIMNPPPYRRFAMPWVASEAIKDIVAAREDIFNPKIVEVLFRAITIYPPGSWVILTNDLVGQVKEVNKDNILKPKVEVLARLDGQKVEPFIIDLSHESVLNIKDTISDSEAEKIVSPK